MEKTIVLVGLMGAGKSTIGRGLAKELDTELRDSDDEIEEAAGCSISDIFTIHGEEIFRDLEQRVIARMLTDGTPRILATGGGAWMNPNIRTLTKEHATSIWLRADIDVLIDRVARKNTRPLLAEGDKHAILSRMADERYPFYEQADHTINSDAGNHEEIVATIIETLNLKAAIHA